MYIIYYFSGVGLRLRFFSAPGDALFDFDFRRFRSRLRDRRLSFRFVDVRSLL